MVGEFGNVSFTSFLFYFVFLFFRHPFRLYVPHYSVFFSKENYLKKTIPPKLNSQYFLSVHETKS